MKSMTENFNRLDYEGSICRISTAQAGEYPKNPKNPEPQWKPMSEAELDLTSGYDLNEVLAKSILFYEAQRAGPLDNPNRIPYRGSSTLKDGCTVKSNLEGGWFDAGDHVKFALPGAWSATLLAMGLLDYHRAYKNADELENAAFGIKWQLGMTHM